MYHGSELFGQIPTAPNTHTIRSDVKAVFALAVSMAEGRTVVTDSISDRY